MKWILILFFFFISCNEKEKIIEKEYEVRKTLVEINARTSPYMGRRGYIYGGEKMYISDAVIDKNKNVYIIDKKGNWILCRSTPDSDIEYWIYESLTREVDSLELLRARFERFVEYIHLGTVYTKDIFISERDLKRIKRYYELCCPEYSTIRIVEYKSGKLIYELNF